MLRPELGMVQLRHLFLDRPIGHEPPAVHLVGFTVNPTRSIAGGS